MTTLGNDVRSGRPGEVGGEYRSSGNGCYVHSGTMVGLGTGGGKFAEAGILDQG